MNEEFPRFVAAGEALTDMIRDAGEHWISKTGGSTWNVARAVAALGVRSAFAGAISRCCFGDDLWEASRDAGLDLRFLQRVERAPLLAIVAQSHPPHYFFIGNDAADLHFDPAQLPAGWPAKAEWAHFGGISLARSPLAEHLIALAGELRAEGVSISYDPNFRNLMDERYITTFESMCRLASVIKLSDEDLAGLLPSSDPAAALARVHALNPKAWWLYTEGAKGATLITPEGRWQGPPPSITVVDTVGAGDASIAGLLASRMLFPEKSAEAHLRFAIAAGAAACQQAGATSPTLDDVMALIGEIKVVDELEVRPL
jgi:fructokinase